MQKAFMKCTHWPIWISLHQEKDNNSVVLTHKQLISSMIRGTTKIPVSHNKATCLA